MKFDLNAIHSPSGHEWASRGLTRKALNFVAQCPMPAWMALVFLVSMSCMILTNQFLGWIMALFCL